MQVKSFAVIKLPRLTHVSIKKLIQFPTHSYILAHHLNGWIGCTIPSIPNTFSIFKFIILIFYSVVFDWFIITPHNCVAMILERGLGEIVSHQFTSRMVHYYHVYEFCPYRCKSLVDFKINLFGYVWWKMKIIESSYGYSGMNDVFTQCLCYIL